MNAFRVDEDMPIESGMLTRSLESAQKKVETYYYDIRKQVFEYDEVMNNQRKAVYGERLRVLKGSLLSTRGPGETYLWCTSYRANGKRWVAMYGKDNR